MIELVMIELGILAVLETIAFLCIKKSYKIQEETREVSEHALFLQLSGCIILILSAIWLYFTIWLQIASII